VNIHYLRKIQKDYTRRRDCFLLTISPTLGGAYPNSITPTHSKALVYQHKNQQRASKERIYKDFLKEYGEYSLSQKNPKGLHKKERLLSSYYITYTRRGIPHPGGQSDMGGSQLC
jgi:hypothetical protein